MYCIISENREEVNTTKGVTTSIEFKEYKNVLFNKKLIRHKMKRIQSKLNKIGTYVHINNKRFILNYGITTLAYFHKDLKY